MAESTDQSVSIDQLTQAVTAGVLRALAETAAQDSPRQTDAPFNIGGVAARNGVYGKVTVLCGIWPADRDPGDLGAGTE